MQKAREGGVPGPAVFSLAAHAREGHKTGLGYSDRRIYALVLSNRRNEVTVDTTFGSNRFSSNK